MVSKDEIKMLPDAGFSEANFGLASGGADLGRGCWTTIGGTTPYYQVGVGEAEPQATDPEYIAEAAVGMGVQAIQRILNTINVARMKVDGVFGTVTEAAVKTFQAQQMLSTADVDGVVGPQTAQLLVKVLIGPLEIQYLIPNHYLFGVCEQESMFDPGAVGYTTPSDKGLMQFNTNASGYDFAQEFNPLFATEHAAIRMASAARTFEGRGLALQEDCMIAQHNSPLWAQQWFATGEPPNTIIKNYVANVKKYGAHY
jgi:hypothetical protein